MAGCVVVSQDYLRNSSPEDLLGRGCTDPTPYTTITREILKQFELGSPVRGCGPVALTRVNGWDASSSHRRINRKPGKLMTRVGKWKCSAASRSTSAYQAVHAVYINQEGI